MLKLSAALAQSCSTGSLPSSIPCFASHEPTRSRHSPRRSRRSAFLTGAAISIALATVGSLAQASAAAADPITIIFTVSPAAGDPVNQQSSTGTFTFDSSLIPPGGGLVESQSGLGAEAIEFSWGTTSWTTGNADLGSLWFDPSGQLEGWVLGGFPTTIRGLQSGPASSVVDDFYLDGGWFFTYTNAGFNGELEGRSVWRQAESAVPEPGTLMLLAAGVVGLREYSRKRGSTRRDAFSR